MNHFITSPSLRGMGIKIISNYHLILNIIITVTGTSDVENRFKNHRQKGPQNMYYVCCITKNTKYKV